MDEGSVVLPEWPALRSWQFLPLQRVRSAIALAPLAQFRAGLAHAKQQPLAAIAAVAVLVEDPQLALVPVDLIQGEQLAVL